MSASQSLAGDGRSTTAPSPAGPPITVRRRLASQRPTEPLAEAERETLFVREFDDLPSDHLWYCGGDMLPAAEPEWGGPIVEALPEDRRRIDRVPTRRAA